MPYQVSWKIRMKTLTTTVLHLLMLTTLGYPHHQVLLSHLRHQNYPTEQHCYPTVIIRHHLLPPQLVLPQEQQLQVHHGLQNFGAAAVAAIAEHHPPQEGHQSPGRVLLCHLQSMHCMHQVDSCSRVNSITMVITTTMLLLPNQICTRTVSPKILQE